MQTYYVLLHMRRHSRDARGAIINRLRSLIDVERDMIARIDVADRLFFNENTLKGVSPGSCSIRHQPWYLSPSPIL